MAAEFGHLGAVVLDADQMAHEELERPDIQDSIQEAFGREVFDQSGSLNRKKLAKIVFEDEKQRKILEGLIHPGVRKKMENTIQMHQQSGQVPMIVLDIPLLYESGWMDRCDVTIFIETTPDIRKERVQKRGWTPEEFQAREQSQESLETKKKEANFIIQNTGSVQELKSQVRNLFNTIMNN